MTKKLMIFLDSGGVWLSGMSTGPTSTAGYNKRMHAIDLGPKGQHWFFRYLMYCTAVVVRKIPYLPIGGEVD
jgi:hypothetical protein